MKSKKLVSAITALTLIASTFFCVGLNAEAKNTSDYNVQALQDFESYAAGDVTTVVGTSFTDSGSTQIARLTPNTSSGSRIIFNNSAIVQDGSNKYFTTEIKPNNSTKTDFYNVGALYFGGRDTTAYNKSLGQTRVFTADVRFYGATQMMLADQTNATPRMGYKDYVNLSYASGTISWAGTGTKSVDSGWHNIVVVDTAGSSFVEDTGVSHTTKLYIDGEYIGSNTVYQTATANGANHIGFAAFLAATTTQTKIDVDNLELYTLAQDSANTAIVSVADGGSAYINPTSETKTLQLSGKVVHNTTDNIDITDFYSASPTWEISPAVTGVSVDSTGLVTVSNEFDAANNNSATVVYTAGAKSESLNVRIVDVSGYIINTTPYSIVTVDGTDYNSGYTGAVQFPVGTTGTKTVTITKPGYTDRTESVTFADNQDDTYTLSPSEAGVTYYEDFTNVNDLFGFDGNSTSGITVANGTLTIPFNSTNAGQVATLPVPLDLSGNKLLTINMKVSGASVNHYFYLGLTGTGINIYNYGGSPRIHGSGGNSGWIDTLNDSDLQLNYTTTKSHLSTFVNGKKSGGDTIYTGTTLTALTIVTGGKGSPVDYINSIKVSEMPATATITIDDDGTTSSTSYLAGTSFTLPAATGKEGYEFTGWSDGTNTYDAGATVTADETRTYTARYEQIVPKITFTEKTGFASETGNSGTVRFSTTFVKSNWPTENAPTLSNVGYALFDVSGWTNDEPETISTVEAAMKGYKAGNTPNDSKVFDEDTKSNITKDTPFYYEIKGIPSSVKGLRFYAVPYMEYEGLGTFWGAPITYKPNFDWTKYGKTTATVQEGSTVVTDPVSATN